MLQVRLGMHAAIPGSTLPGGCIAADQMHETGWMGKCHELQQAGQTMECILDHRSTPDTRA